MIKRLIASHAAQQQHHNHSSSSSSFVIVTDASALHSGLNIRKTRRFLDKLEALLHSASNNWRIIPMTVHHVGPNKPKEYLPHQGRQAVEDYNQLLRTLAEKKKNYSLLDTYGITKGMPSYDGTHYPTASVALAQILLLYIRDYVPAAAAATTAAPRDGAVPS
mmetsp:Transcript_3679/g.8474  ORF Transcript_3679/g.8474 Transcript_3679/m.8474 type:complete len:163 (+) Transcript_3679:1096-1584(+)